jgi:1,4-alpha-glucan branching enzyme
MRQSPLLFVAVLAACSTSSRDVTSRSEALGTVTALGATVTDTGVVFRVWAPRADRVFVAGTWNGWNTRADELAREADGVFGGLVPDAAAGAEYKYVLVHGTEPDLWRGDPRARRVVNSAGNSIVVDPSAYHWRATTPSRDPNAEVVYEMHVGTFEGATASHPGTFSAAIGRLDDLAALGVTRIEVMAPAEFAGDYSWGYNPAFAYAPESAYGTPDDLRHFVDEAHARGMGVLIDAVYNHFGPGDNVLNCFDGNCTDGGIYFYPDAKSTRWGQRPNFGVPEVRSFIADNVDMWLSEYRADGIRWDAVNAIRAISYVPNADGVAMLQGINQDLSRRMPDRIQIAEDALSSASLDEPTITEPVSIGGLGFGAKWGFSFVDQLERGILPETDEERGLAGLADSLEHLASVGTTHTVVFLESHDTAASGRFNWWVDETTPQSALARRKMSLGLAVVFTAPGTPMIFQGEEMFEARPFNDTTPLDWSNTSRFRGVYALHRDLIRLRRNLDGASAGLLGDRLSIVSRDATNSVLVYTRSQSTRAGSDVIIATNFSDASQSFDLGLPTDGAWNVRLDTSWDAYVGDGGAAKPTVTLTAEPGSPSGAPGSPFHARITLGPSAVMILSR